MDASHLHYLKTVSIFWFRKSGSKKYAVPMTAEKELGKELNKPISPLHEKEDLQLDHEWLMSAEYHSSSAYGMWNISFVRGIYCLEHTETTAMRNTRHHIFLASVIKKSHLQSCNIKFTTGIKYRYRCSHIFLSRCSSYPKIFYQFHH